jgi:hypothetical protein
VSNNSTYLVAYPNTDGGVLEFTYRVNEEAGIGDHRLKDFKVPKGHGDSNYKFLVLILGIFIISIVVFRLFFYKRVKKSIFRLKVVKKFVDVADVEDTDRSDREMKVGDFSDVRGSVTS